MPPAKLPCVRREHTHVEAVVPGSFQQADCQLVIVRHVQLVEAWALAIGFSDCFDGLRAGGGQRIRDVELLGNFCNGKLAEGVVDLVDAYWGDAYWGGDFVAKDGGTGSAGICVYELPGDNAVPEEGLTVGEVGVRLASIGGGVVPRGNKYVSGGSRRGSTHQPFCVSFSFASSSSLPGSGANQPLILGGALQSSPVLKGGTCPSFAFQKFSLW